MKRIILIALISILSTVSPTCDDGVSVKLSEVGLTYYKEGYAPGTRSQGDESEANMSHIETPYSFPTAKTTNAIKSIFSAEVISAPTAIILPEDTHSHTSVFVESFGYIENSGSNVGIDFQTGNEQICVEGYGFIPKN